MVELTDEDLTGSRFERVDLSEARFHNLLMRDVKITGAWIEDLVIEAAIEGPLVVNDVDVRPFVEAELNRRHPGREAVYAVRTCDADGVRAAWAVDERVWADTVERARRLPEDLLHERVDGEWSFIQTLRHLVMATDAWGKRALLGESNPFHPLGLPHDEMGEVESVPNDPDARPSLEEILAVRADRMATARSIVEALTDERLDGMTEVVTEPGYPASESYPIRRCIGAIVIEEWEHHLFANRDLAVLEGRP